MIAIFLFFKFLNGLGQQRTEQQMETLCQKYSKMFAALTRNRGCTWVGFQTNSFQSGVDLKKSGDLSA